MNSPYAILKVEVDNFIQQHLPIVEKSLSIFPMIDLEADVTVASSTSTKIVEKMRGLLPFYQFFFLNLVVIDAAI